MNSETSPSHIDNSDPYDSGFDSLKNVPFAGDHQQKPNGLDAMADLLDNSRKRIHKRAEENIEKGMRKISTIASEYASTQYPEIYSEVDEAEIEKTCSRYVERIDKNTAWDIMDTFKDRGYRKGCQYLVKRLSRLLDIEEPPKIKHVANSKDTTNDAAYSSKQNIIYIYHKNDVDSIDRRKPKYSDIDLVSHEMWHAHQFDQLKRGKGKGESYKINANNYFDSRPDPDLEDDPSAVADATNRYYDQLLEQEAFWFGHAVADRCRAVRHSTPDIATEFHRRYRRRKIQSSVSKLNRYL